MHGCWGVRTIVVQVALCVVRDGGGGVVELSPKFTILSVIAGATPVYTTGRAVYVPRVHSLVRGGMRPRLRKGAI